MMNKITTPARDNIRSLIPYSSARDEYSGSNAIFLDANENPYGNLNRYPDPHQEKLKDMISTLKGVPRENIFVGNGSDEAIDILFRIFCKPGYDKALAFTPTYGMYKVCADINDIGLVSVPLDHEYDIPENIISIISSTENLKLIIICSPNNPTGNSMNEKKIIDIIENFNGVVAIDEAYIDFCGKPSLSSKLDKYTNIVVLQTFSKAWGLASARVGMAFSDPGIISLFNRVKYPYNVSYLNQQAAIEAISRKDDIEKKVNEIIAQRNKLAEKLSHISTVKEVFPSDTNFLLVRVSNADITYEELVKRGIIVRNRSSVVEGCLRITVGTPEENDKLIESLEKSDKR